MLQQCMPVCTSTAQPGQVNTTISQIGQSASWEIASIQAAACQVHTSLCAQLKLQSIATPQYDFCMPPVLCMPVSQVYFLLSALLPAQRSFSWCSPWSDVSVWAAYESLEERFRQGPCGGPGDDITVLQMTTQAGHENTPTVTTGRIHTQWQSI